MVAICTAFVKSSVQGSTTPRRCECKAKPGTLFCGRHSREKKEKEPVIIVDNNKECCICLENLIDKKCTKTDCGHYFHTECLNKWKKWSDDCPLCRESMTGKKQEVHKQPPEIHQSEAITRLIGASRNGMQALIDSLPRNSYWRGYYTAIRNSLV